MFKYAFKIVALLCFLGWSYAQLAGSGACPEHKKSVADLDIDKFLGFWFEYSKYPYIFELNSECVKIEFSHLDEKTIKINNTEKIGNKYKISLGKATQVEPGIYLVVMNTDPTLHRDNNFTVIATDYENYAITYACSDFGAFHITMVAIITREREPSPTTIETAEGIIKREGFLLERILKTNQANCLT